MLRLRAFRVSATFQLVSACSRGNRVSVVPWPNSTGTSSLAPCATCHFGPFFSMKVAMSSVLGTEPSGQVPVAAPSTRAL
jgi:hypothetical protein